MYFQHLGYTDVLTIYKILEVLINFQATNMRGMKLLTTRIWNRKLHDFTNIDNKEDTCI